MLDAGCGLGKWGFLVRLPDVEWMGGNKPSFVVGVDLSLHSLKFAKERKVYDSLILADVRYMPLRRDSFDTVLMAEVIEHLSKAEGYKALLNLEKIARKRIIVTTPNYPDIIGPAPNDISDQLQLHRSRWTHREFFELGYNVKGLGFVLRLGKWHSFRLFELLLYLPWIFKAFIRFSAFLIAVKDTMSCHDNQ
jgi:SAM-dependent methyltransferase